MKIKDEPNIKNKPDPLTFNPEDSVRTALDIMCEKNVGSIVVITPDNMVAGIVTERDMMIRVLGPGLDPAKTKLSEIMTTDVKTANINDELVDWMKTMSNQRFRHLPVVDEHGKLINVMSQGDFVAHTWPDLYEKISNDLGGIAKPLQIGLVVFTVLTLILIALGK